MLKLRIQAGSTVTIGRESAIQLLAIEGQEALFRISSPDFYSAILYAPKARRQKAFSSEGKEHLIVLPEGSSVHFADCTALVKIIRPSAVHFEFMAPKSINIERNKETGNTGRCKAVPHYTQQ